MVIHRCEASVYDRDVENTCVCRPYTQEDTLFRTPDAAPYPFAFDSRVAKVFDDMVQRSVPGYRLSLELITALAPQFCLDTPSVAIDLGSALGSSSLAIVQGMHRAIDVYDHNKNMPSNRCMNQTALREVSTQGCTVIAVDNSPAMIAACRSYLQRLGGVCAIQLHQADVMEFSFPAADFIVMHFSLQFIPLQKREQLLTKCRQALKRHGALLLFEKIATSDLLATAHTQFKRNCGYNQLEIFKKREALENVMHIESESDHKARLEACGFRRIDCCFRALNFCGWVARV